MGSTLRHVFRAIDWMNIILRHLIGAMLGVMVVVVAIQIVVRFVLPLLGLVVAVPWSEELARYLMIWCIFLGAAVATRGGALIAMESVVDALPTRLGHTVRAIGLLITLVFFALLIWLGLRWSEFGWSETSTVMSLPMIWVYAAMPVGSALSIINIVALMIERRTARAAVAAAASIV